MTHSGAIPGPRVGRTTDDDDLDSPQPPADRPDLTPHLDRATPARIYDYLLGGKDNFAVDRQAARTLIGLLGEDTARSAAQENRAFVRRTAQWMADQGIGQFIDLGAGLPTDGNVHEVVQQVDPAAHVVYVDNDPIVLAHGRALLADSPDVDIITADLRRPDEVFAHPTTRRLIDTSRPVGLLMFAVLHFVSDDDQPADLVRTYAGQLVSGSMIGLSHTTRDGFAPELVAEAVSVYRRTTTTMTPRSREEIAALLEGFELVEPGLVHPWAWRPDRVDRVGTNVSYGAVARLH
ncbi:MAG TPA: SAM-dependent methyltransferase [Kineosporiaceae bacterium]